MESIKYVGGKGLKLNLMYLECWNIDHLPES